MFIQIGEVTFNVNHVVCIHAHTAPEENFAPYFMCLDDCSRLIINKEQHDQIIEAIARGFKLLTLVNTPDNLWDKGNPVPVVPVMSEPVCTHQADKEEKGH